MSFAEWAGNEPLAMTADAAARVAEILSDPESLAARKGQRPDGIRCMEVRDGVADIAIRGPISRYETFWSWLLGGTSTEAVSKALHAALDDPEVKGVVLHVDSPGGQATGIGELASYIRRAGKQKPVVAYVEGIGASAAYWLATAASRVVISPSATVGSIGTIVQMDGRSRPGELTFVSSQSPKKRVDPNTPEGAADIQAWLDSLSEVFIADVARYRGVTPKRVMKDFGAGGVLVGKAAVDAGMADALGDFESVAKAIRDTKSGMGKERKPDDRKPAGTNRGNRMNPFNVLGRLWSKDADAVQEALEAEGVGGAFATLKTAPAPALSADQIKAEIKAEFEAREAAAKADAEKVIAKAKADAAAEAKAKAFVAGIVKAEKATPADAANLELVALALAAADAADPIERDGKPVSRFDVFAGQIEARKPHGLTADVIPADGKGLKDGFKALASADDSEDKAKEIEARIAKALEATDLGKATKAK